MKHKIINCAHYKLNDVIKEHEKQGYEVAGLTWVECDLEFVIVFKANENPRIAIKPEVIEKKEDKKETLEDMIKRIIDEESKKHPYIDPYTPLGPGESWKTVPYEPYPWKSPITAPSTPFDPNKVWYTTSTNDLPKYNSSKKRKFKENFEHSFAMN